MRVEIDDAMAERIRHRYERGVAVGRLAAAYGVSARTIQRAIVRAGGQLRTTGAKTDEELAEHIRQGMVKGYGCSAIASHVGVSYDRCRRIMDEIIDAEPELFDEPDEYELELEEEEQAEAYRAMAEGYAFDAWYDRVREERHGDE